MEGAHGGNIKAPSPGHGYPTRVEEELQVGGRNPNQEDSARNMNAPSNPQETTDNPYATETLFFTVDVDEAVVQKIQRQNGLYSIHASADRFQTLYDLFHSIAIQICSANFKPNYDL